jgi:hypothetical protein
MERTGAFTSAVEMERRGLRLRLSNEVRQADRAEAVAEAPVGEGRAETSSG